jgi:hypothetical protein
MIIYIAHSSGFGFIADIDVGTTSVTDNFRLELSLPFARNTRFAGRKSELERLTEIVNGDGTQTRTIAVLYGLGGMGKTEIVLEHVYQSLDRYSSIFWIHGATKETAYNGFIGIAQRLIHHYAANWPNGNLDYVQIACKLHIPGLIDSNGQLLVDKGPDAKKNIVQAVKIWLSSDGNSKWLLVFDNVDNADEIRSFEGTDYLPSRPVGTVIVTSRLQESKYIGTGSVEIEGMDEANAVAFLVKRSGKDLDLLDVIGSCVPYMMKSLRSAKTRFQ